MSIVQSAFESILRGDQLDRKTAYQLAEHADKKRLFELADQLRIQFHGHHFELCSIINARSGTCSEDCRFCAQSSRYQTGIQEYPLIDSEKALVIALDNDNHGVKRLSLVTSGRTVSTSFLREIGRLYKKISEKTSFKFCASLGFLTPDKAEQLQKMGVSRYHCNLETCREFFPQVCSTHSYEAKVETLKYAARKGLSLCSGGIIGMGESMRQRIDLAFELHDLEVLSIPINILTPIKETPCAEQTPLSVKEVLTTVALFRFINPRAVIRIAGGRQQLGEEQYRCFTAGANGAIVGNYLTTVGSGIAEDLKKIAELGFTF